MFYIITNISGMQFTNLLYNTIYKFTIFTKLLDRLKILHFQLKYVFFFKQLQFLPSAWSCLAFSGKSGSKLFKVLFNFSEEEC